ncbi:protein KIBRA [Crotalus adamanteus]|uniref:Protein KIBRA n=1 Tax=Crotalus adamanteus TaxID=8729 RepID=A0AAW1B2S1_CROAD
MPWQELPLPEGWEEACDYVIDHATKTTSWVDPWDSQLAAPWGDGTLSDSAAVGDEKARPTNQRGSKEWPAAKKLNLPQAPRLREAEAKQRQTPFRPGSDSRLLLGGEPGCWLTVNMDYPKELHNLYNDYSLAPENIIPEGSKVQKLIPNLYNKTKYSVHYEALKQYECLGMKFTKIHCGINFREEPWLKPYIDLNTNLRMQATNKFEKDFFFDSSFSIFNYHLPWVMMV